MGPAINSAAGSTNPNVYEDAAVVARAAGFGLDALSYEAATRSSAAALVAALRTLSGDADHAAGPEANLGAVSQTIENDYSAVTKDSANLIGILSQTR